MWLQMLTLHFKDTFGPYPQGVWAVLHKVKKVCTNPRQKKYEYFNHLSTCLVVVINSIFFVFLIGLFCLLHVFRTLYLDFKSEKTISSLKTPNFLVSLPTESTVLYTVQTVDLILPCIGRIPQLHSCIEKKFLLNSLC